MDKKFDDITDSQESVQQTPKDSTEIIESPFPPIVREYEKGQARIILNKLVGLDEVKKVVSSIIAINNFNKKRCDAGLEKIQISNPHICLLGNPGCGKSTVSKLIAYVIADENNLDYPIFIETSRAKIVGRYQGFTSQIIHEKFKLAEHGVLFIDEFHDLANGENDNFGNEAINAVVYEMERNRENVMVILAGYSDKAQAFISKNQGLKSRIGHIILIPDYTPKQLFEIMHSMLNLYGNLSIANDTLPKLDKVFCKAVKAKDFGNGRFVRQLLENAIINMALRTSNIDSTSAEELSTLISDDFEINTVMNSLKSTKDGTKQITIAGLNRNGGTKND